MKNIFLSTKKSGFTLIELLVVIAIIGILSSVVLSSLNTARNKSKNAAVKSGMANLRSEMEMYFAENGKYGDYAGTVWVSKTGDSNTQTNHCSDTKIKSILGNVATNAGNTAYCEMGASNSWIGYTAFNGEDPTTGRNYCVDYTGFSGEFVGLPTNRTATQVVSCR